MLHLSPGARAIRFVGVRPLPGVPRLELLRARVAVVLRETDLVGITGMKRLVVRVQVAVQRERRRANERVDGDAEARRPFSGPDADALGAVPGPDPDFRLAVRPEDDLALTKEGERVVEKFGVFLLRSSFGLHRHLPFLASSWNSKSALPPLRLSTGPLRLVSLCNSARDEVPPVIRLTARCAYRALSPHEEALG